MEPNRRGRSARRFLAISAASLVLGLLFVEGAFRWLLFGGATAEQLGGNLRHASYFADSASDDDFWKLFLELDRTQPPISAEIYHPELGWVSPDLDTKTLQHRETKHLRGRRPVLLYGDSFARCMGKRRECFELLLATSDLADRYVLLNHGVQGYGLDQIHLLIERTVDLYAGQKPVVIVSLQVDDCLDRLILSIRGWPKPRFRPDAEALVLEETPVPSIERILERDPVSIRSYAWRYLLYGSPLLSENLKSRLRGDASIIERKQAIDRKVLTAIVSRLRDREVEFYFLLFYGEPYVNGSKPSDWREALLMSAFRELDVPFTSALRAIRKDSARSGRPIADYFGQGLDPSRGHFLSIGNEVAFRALRDGLEGRFEVP